MASQERGSLSQRDLATLTTIGVAGVFAIVGVSLALILARVETTQWDFRAYYWGARAWAAGADPYDQGQLARLSGREDVLPFHYPPLLLMVFRPLAHLPYHAAAYLWVALKLVVLGLLVRLWRARWLGELSPFLLWAIVFFAFDGTVLRDLGSGNVAVIEQYLLWSGMALLVAGRRLPAGVLLACAAVFRLTPIALALLLLAPGDGDERPAARWQAFGVALAVFAALVVLPGLAFPELGRSYLGALGELLRASTAEAGTGDLSAWAALAWIARAAGWAELAPTLGLVYSLAVIGVSAPALLRAWQARELQRLIMMTVIVYLLCLPLVSTYGLILLIVPSAVLWIGMLRGRAGAEAVFAALVCFGAFHMLPVPLPGLLFDRYWLPLTLTAWLVYLFLERRRALEATAAHPWMLTHR